jgi:hypothetical protein
MLLGVRAFLGMFLGGVPRVATDVAAGVFGSPLAVHRGVQ